MASDKKRVQVGKVHAGTPGRETEPIAASSILLPSASPSAGSARPRATPLPKAERRQRILEAALAVFSAHGYSAARLEDVARQAGVAKGTLYLYFADKEALFRGLVEDLITPVVLDADELVSAFPGDSRVLLGQLMDLLVTRIIEGPAVMVLRLMLTEGQRFPDLAAYYHREVVSRALTVVRKVAQHGQARGELHSDALERFPQLLVAPALLGMVWNSLFGAVEPLDVRALMLTYRDLLLNALGWREP